MNINTVIPSEVEGSRRESLKVPQRDSSTPLRFPQNDTKGGPSRNISTRFLTITRQGGTT
jgi:hypothetical protein